MADSEQSEDEFCDIVAMYLYAKSRRKRKRGRQIYILKMREEYREYYYLVKQQLFTFPVKFYQYFRMLPAQFNEILHYT